MAWQPRLDLSQIPVRPLVFTSAFWPDRVSAALAENMTATGLVYSGAHVALRAAGSAMPRQQAAALAALVGVVIATLQFTAMEQATPKPAATEVRDQFY